MNDDDPEFDPEALMDAVVAELSDTQVDNLLLHIAVSRPGNALGDGTPYDVMGAVLAALAATVAAKVAAAQDENAKSEADAATQEFDRARLAELAAQVKRAAADIAWKRSNPSPKPH